ncbi:MAG: TIR domain-containing protein [Bryobacterales bacterium]|nr:TIR domain-containing protein [Bryobacterales bacterium]
MTNEVAAPKVFISYSWSFPAHVEWVIQFASELRESGVDVVLDKWDLREGQDKYAFMEQMVRDPEITKVIMICDKEYVKKAEKRAGGVGAETQIITPELYNDTSQDQFVAVVTERDENNEPYVPIYYGSRIFIDFSEAADRSESFDQILRWIFDKPVYIRPPLGKVPGFIRDGNRTISLATSSRFKRASHAIRNGRSEARAYVEEYFETVSKEFSKIRMRSESANEFDEMLIEHLESFLPYRDEIVEMFLLLSRYYGTDTTAKLMHRFLESLIPYMSAPPDVGQYREWDFDNYRFIIHELFLYGIASLIRHERFGLADELIRTGFYVPIDSGRARSDLAMFDTFGRHTKSLEYRNQRLKLNRLSLRSDLIKERSHGTDIRFQDLMQADFVLFLRSCLNPQGGAQWWPVTLLYSHYNDTPFEILARSESTTYFNQIKILLGLSDKNELGNLLKSFEQNHRVLPTWQHHYIAPRALSGYDKICTKL